MLPPDEKNIKKKDLNCGKKNDNTRVGRRARLFRKANSVLILYAT